MVSEGPGRAHRVAKDPGDKEQAGRIGPQPAVEVPAGAG